MKNFTNVISGSRKIKIKKSFWLVEAKFSDFVTQTMDFCLALAVIVHFFIRFAPC